MRKKVFFVLVLLFFMFVSGATAMPISLVGEDHVQINQYLGQWKSFTYIHDVDVPEGYAIDSYSLTVGLRDDYCDPKGIGQYEIAIVDQPGWSGDGLYDFSRKEQNFGMSYAGLVNLNQAGQLVVKILSGFGDFKVLYSDLDYHATASAAPVPEPATMFLLGTGLVFIAGASRRKLFKAA